MRNSNRRAWWLELRRLVASGRGDAQAVYIPEIADGVIPKDDRYCDPDKKGELSEQDQLVF